MNTPRLRMIGIRKNYGPTAALAGDRKSVV